MIWTIDRKWRQPKPTWVTLVMVCILFGCSAAGISVFMLAKVSPLPLPSGIRSQVHFPIFYPRAGVIVDSTSYKYDKQSGVLSFTGAVAGEQVATFAEQSTPEPFNDIPNYYSQFLAKIYEYSAFDSIQGTVHLTHPQGAGQVAVMNVKGTLIFIRVAHDEPKATWLQIFNKLDVYTL